MPFLLDENLSPRLRTAVLRRAPVADILRVGDQGAPPRATRDPDILEYAEQTQRLLVTTNRASTPAEITACNWYYIGNLTVERFPSASLTIVSTFWPPPRSWAFAFKSSIP
ncbi:MAG: DUF5615 family PIN-like protein [Chloroflexi bacterium]|nr:DUF5615 family PIN-like protein [Chloroflexota bacterium]